MSAIMDRPPSTQPDVPSAPSPDKETTPGDGTDGNKQPRRNRKILVIGSLGLLAAAGGIAVVHHSSGNDSPTTVGSKIAQGGGDTGWQDPAIALRRRVTNPEQCASGVDQGLRQSAQSDVASGSWQTSVPDKATLQLKPPTQGTNPDVFQWEYTADGNVVYAVDKFGNKSPMSSTIDLSKDTRAIGCILTDSPVNPADVKGIAPGNGSSEPTNNNPDVGIDTSDGVLLGAAVDYLNIHQPDILLKLGINTISAQDGAEIDRMTPQTDGTIALSVMVYDADNDQHCVIVTCDPSGNTCNSAKLSY